MADQMPATPGVHPRSPVEDRKMYGYLLIGLGVALGIVTLVAKLGQIANRPPAPRRRPESSIPEQQPVHRTERERQAAWAELTAPIPSVQVPTEGRPEWEIGLDRQIQYDLTVLDGAERMLTQGLDRIWQQVVKELNLDRIDQAWALLSSGERAAVTI